MNKKIIDLEKIRKERENYNNKSFMIDELLNLTEVIEDKMNEMYYLGEKYKNAGGKCTDEQMKLFSKIVCSYFRILYDVIDNYNGSEDENRILYNFAHHLDEICTNLPNMDEVLTSMANKEIVPCDKNYTIYEILKFPEIIENKINEIYAIGEKNEKIRFKCTEEQIKIFTKVVCSYFIILFDEIEFYTGTEEENRVLYNFAKDLDSICSELPDLQKIIKEEDKRVLRLENSNKNNV